MRREIGAMLRAELFQLRKRTSTWVLLGIWAAMGLFFGYVLPYLIETPDAAGSGPVAALLPDRMIGEVVSGFPFYGGAIAIMLGVLSVGSEFGWGTFKTLFTQRPGRGAVIGAKLGALAVMLIPFVLVSFAIGGVSSALIALREGYAVDFAPVAELVRAVLAGWMILAAWASVGVLLAVATRGTSLAIGIGIIWALVIEGLLGIFAESVSWLGWVNSVMLRSNAYSLVEPLGGGTEGDGPGAFTGPYVEPVQALLALSSLMVVSVGISLVLLRRRDVA
jgi:ABC-2 type transport system permease protein